MQEVCGRDACGARGLKAERTTQLAPWKRCERQGHNSCCALTADEHQACTALAGFAVHHRDVVWVPGGDHKERKCLEPRRQWNTQGKGSFLCHEGSGNARQRQCLSDRQERQCLSTQAVETQMQRHRRSRRQWKHRAKAVEAQGKGSVVSHEGGGTHKNTQEHTRQRWNTQGKGSFWHPEYTAEYTAVFCAMPRSTNKKPPNRR